MKGKGKSKLVTKVKSELESDYSFISYSSGYTSSNLTKESSNFSTVLQNRDIKDLCIDDLRAVQFELEDQLTTAIKRRKHLENKIFSLETLHSKKDKRSRSTDSIEKKTGDERPPKKAKESSSKAHSTSTSSQAKGKFIPPSFSDSHQEVSKPSVKNDAPSRFWTFIEPYCADITQDTIRAVEDWISPHENDETFQRIPPLGEHFSKKWPIDDFTDELIEGSKSVENNKGLYSDSAEDHAEVERLLKLGESESSLRIDGNYPSICDRLICSLVGENLMTQLDDTMNEACNDDIIQNTNPIIMQISSLPNKDSLENRLRAEFIESGLLETDDMETETEDDEICRELKRLQNALIPVHEHNTMQKKKLLALAKAEMAKQEVKKKLQELDAKVMEVYRTAAVARRNKAMNKKLEDQIKRTLRERKKLVEKLAAMK